MGIRRRTIVAVAAGLGLLGGLVLPGVATAQHAGSGHLSSSQVTALSRDPDLSVIVIFKDQVATLPPTQALSGARTRAVGRIQAPVLAELRELKVPALHSVSLVNAVTATVSAPEATRLASDPAVAAVLPNASTQLRFSGLGRAAVADATGTSLDNATTASTPACQPGRDGVELDPQALEAIHANSDLPGLGPTAASLGITGAGVKVAYLAGGIDIDDPDFIRADGAHVFVATKDFTGEGDAATTSDGEASLDASSIAAQGRQIYTVRLPSGAACKIRVLGAAPGASLVGLKVFPDNYDATTTSLLLGINYAVVTDHVAVLNESFGYDPLPDTMVDVIRMADEAAVKAGTVVDVSSGDAGPTSTVGSPSTDPGVISAGASTTYRAYAQDDIADYTQIHATGWEDDNLSGLSSGGFGEQLKGPDVVAPGDLNWVACNNSPGSYQACVSGGTSEAAPLTSATAALVIQAYRKTHAGASPTPALVKQIITSTASDLGLPGYEQGSGIVDAYRAVEAAMSVKTSAGTPKPRGSALLTSTDLIAATAPVDSTITRSVAVTNVGSRKQTVRLHGRILSAPSTLTAGRFTEPGGSWTKVMTFKVGSGWSHLDASAATVPSTGAGVIDVTLLNPRRRLVIDGIPQGITSTSNVDVRSPAAGLWTAYVTFEALAPSTGSEPVAFTATAEKWHRFGSVSPGSLTLEPGATRTVSVAMRTASSAGDESAAVELDAPLGARTSIPVALRALVPLEHGTGRFTTSVIGGNGRGGATASTHYFAFDVPAGMSNLDVTTAYANGPENAYSTYLVSPAGETLGHASNQLVIGGTPTDPVTTTEGGTVSHVLSPDKGRWILVVAFSDPASGAAVSSPLTGTIDFDSVPVRALGLPTSTATVLPVGATTVAQVQVTNTTNVSQTYFLDARLDHEVTKTLTPLAPATDIPLPLAAGIPQWIVPTDTTALNARADATAPVTFDMSPYLGDFGGELNGDPQIGATSTRHTATAEWADNPITPGVWNVDPALTGVWGQAGAAKAQTDLTLTARTMAFNRAITTAYGDLWADPTSAFNPVIVGPGQTTTLYAVIAPVKAGVARGTLYLDSASSLDPFGDAIPAGDQLASLPYSYTAQALRGAGRAPAP